MPNVKQKNAKQEVRCNSWVSGTYSFRGHRCGKPAKGTLKNGSPACGRHLAGERRREQNDKERDEEVRLRIELRKEGEKRLRLIKRALGIRAYLAGYDSATVGLDELENLVRRLRKG